MNKYDVDIKRNVKSNIENWIEVEEISLDCKLNSLNFIREHYTGNYEGVIVKHVLSNTIDTM